MAGAIITTEEFSLKWDNFESALATGFADLLDDETMLDVTLAVDGKLVQAHKVVLSVCSVYFRNMFKLNPCKHPIVIMNNVGYQEMIDLLDFMYRGEARVHGDNLPAFLKLAETLKIKGLACANDKAKTTPTKSTTIKPKSNSSYAEVKFEPLTSDDEPKKKKMRSNSQVAKKGNDSTEDLESDGHSEGDMGNDFDDLKGPAIDFLDDNLEDADEKLIAGTSSMDETGDSTPQEATYRFQLRVPIWDFYFYDTGTEIATCKICANTLVVRKCNGSSGLHRHLKRYHPEESEVAERLRARWLALKETKYMSFLEETVPNLFPV